jgi:hypothetical protein
MNSSSFCVFATILQVLIYRSERGFPGSMLLEKPRPSVETADSAAEQTTETTYQV